MLNETRAAWNTIISTYIPGVEVTEPTGPDEQHEEQAESHRQAADEAAQRSRARTAMYHNMDQGFVGQIRKNACGPTCIRNALRYCGAMYDNGGRSAVFAKFDADDGTKNYNGAETTKALQLVAALNDIFAEMGRGGTAKRHLVDRHG